MLTLGALLLHSYLSILTSVTVNGNAGFLLTELVGVQSELLSNRLSGLVLYDELAAISASLVWGALLDRFGLAPICALAHVVTSIGLLCIATFHASFLEAALARVLFALGFSGLMVCLVGGLAKFSKERLPVSTETEPLLAVPPKTTSGLLAGIVNVTTALGAVTAALAVNRLPSRIGLPQTFLFVAALEAVMAVLAALLLRVPKVERPQPTTGHVAALGRGVKLCRRDPEILLACLASFASRAQTVVLMAFVPSLVAQFYVRSGRCNPGLPAEQLKQGCRAAYALSSSLTGTSQLVGLIIAPLCGLALHRWLTRPPIYLAAGYLCGAIGFALIVTLPGGDPRVLAQAIPGVVLVGVSQGTGMVTSLALVGDARLRYASQSTSAEEVAGAVSAAYGVSGSLGIILITQVGAWLASLTSPTAVFALQAAIFVLVASLAVGRASAHVHS